MSGTDTSERKFEPAFPGQHADEVVQFLFRQHPMVMRKTLIVGLLVILVGVLPLDFPQVYTSPALASVCIKIALGLPVVVFVVWFWRWIGWYYTMYIVTNRRIMDIKQRGLFDRKVSEWPLDNISNVNYHVGGFQAVLFGYGTITVRTYIGDLVMEAVHKPAEVHEQLVAAVRKAGGGSTPPSN